MGSLPAGDAMAESGNIAIPTLIGHDARPRHQVARQVCRSPRKLDNVGAEIAFSVGMQSLEIRAKCLRKDLPLVLGLIAAELRTPALLAGEFDKARQQFIGELEASRAEHAVRGAGGLRPRDVSGRPSEPAAHLE